MRLDQIQNYIMDGGDPDKVFIEVDPSFRQNAKITYFSIQEERRRQRNGKRVAWLYGDSEENCKAINELSHQ